MKQSAGTLLYRCSAAGLEVLLVHPSGNYNRHKPWSIPKGIPDRAKAWNRRRGAKRGKRPASKPGRGRWDRSIIARAANRCMPSPARPPTRSRGRQLGSRSGGVRQHRQARQLIHPEQRLLDRLEQLLSANAAG